MSYSTFFYQCNVVEIIDWNSIDIEIDLGFNITHKTRVRLQGVTAPDSNAKEYVQDWVNGHKHLFIRTFVDDIGDYNRIYGVIYADESANVCLNAQLIDAGLAQPERSGTR
jgi:endonuclease YncB( thermonuclease family)